MVVYDVEVLRGPDEVKGGWQNPEGMGFGTAVVYQYEDDRYYFFNRKQKKDLVEFLWASGPVISFNGIKFDNRVILGNDYNEPGGEYMWTNIDLLLLVVQSKFDLLNVAAAEEKLGDKEVHDGSVGLDGLSEGTLGMHKTGHGAHAPELIRKARWAEVFAYNLHDVRLTRQLFDFAQKYRYLVDRKGNRIVVDI